ncbi:MAG: hypothetical protein U5L72_06685 [Bacteroidales bacterium]|nr:hypothetical protein [Bacteroidales bacterium]
MIYPANKLFDWGASFEGRANVGQNSNLILIEGYGKVRFGVLDVKAGRSKDIMGLCDTTLTSGSYGVSGNGLGIPKIEISIVDFYQIPWFDRLLAIKGNFSHGWFGQTSMKQGGRGRGYITDKHLSAPKVSLRTDWEAYAEI